MQEKSKVYQKRLNDKKAENKSDQYFKKQVKNNLNHLTTPGTEVSYSKKTPHCKALDAAEVTRKTCTFIYISISRVGYSRSFTLKQF